MCNENNIKSNLNRMKLIAERKQIMNLGIPFLQKYIIYAYKFVYGFI